MSRQRRQLRAAARHIGVSLLALAATLLLAPPAVATPESDADAAITGAWNASGGPTGPLGLREGGVYPVGEGFGQNFAGGKMFFTPPTGPRIMQGAILEKYESLGGPADSDLGFPTIDEGPGRAPESRNTTFSAPDKPVIFWTPATGARVVRGAINAAWDKLGGSSGPLGVPAEDEVYRGDVVTQKFTGGELSWDLKTKAFTTVPPELAGQLADLQIPDDPTSAINAARRAAGGPMGPLGAREGPQYPIGADGVGQNFAGGKIFYSPATGASVVTGQVLEKYESVGGPEGELGFPISSETDGGFGLNSRMSTFAAEDKPVIFWTPDYGAVIVRGAMNAAWAKLGGGQGPLGAPMADQTRDGDVISQRFSGGAVSWNHATNAFATEPANLASELSGLQVPGAEAPQAPQAPSAPQATDTAEDQVFTWRWNWWWLLAIVPVLVLAGLVTGAVLWNQRSARAADSRFDADAFGPGGAFDRVPAPTVGGDDTGRGFADQYGDVPSAPLVGSVGAPTAWGISTGDEEDATTQRPVEGFHRAPADLELFGGEEDPDRVDTAPTRIESDLDEPPVESDLEAEPVEEAPVESDVAEEAHSSGHAAILDEPTPGRTALHLPLDDPGQAPTGYPVKADTESGLYWSPDSRLYDDVVAEIWFASEEIARTNGFVKGD
jgi:uncharacterized protein with LGFP repeats